MRSNRPDIISRTSPLSKGLVGYWPVVSTISFPDFSGHAANHMTSVFADPLNLRVDHKGPSYRFMALGGANRGDVMEGFFPLGDMSTISFSLAVWVKFGSSFGTTDPGIVARKTPSFEPSRGWYIFARSSSAPTGRPVFACADGSATFLATWPTAINDDQWHLIVGTLDRENQISSISVDNADPVTISVSSMGSISSEGSSGNFIKFGTRPNNTGLWTNRFLGHVRDVRVWRDKVLTRSEINFLMQERFKYDRQWMLAADITGPPPPSGTGGFNRAVSIITGV